LNEGSVEGRHDDGGHSTRTTTLDLHADRIAGLQLPEHVAHFFPRGDRLSVHRPEAITGVQPRLAPRARRIGDRQPQPGSVIRVVRVRAKVRHRPAILA
jgi:hypothetical protein